MNVFEERCADDYLRQKNTLLCSTQEEKIRVIGDRYIQLTGFFCTLNYIFCEIILLERKKFEGAEKCFLWLSIDKSEKRFLQEPVS